MVTYFLDNGPSENSQLEIRDEICDLPVLATEQTPLITRPKTLIRQNDLSLIAETPTMPSISPSQSHHSQLSEHTNSINNDDIAKHTPIMKTKKQFTNLSNNDSFNQSKNSIENIECLLKNDISLSDLTSRTCFKEFSPDTKPTKIPSVLNNESRTSNEFNYKNVSNLLPRNTTTNAATNLNTQFCNNLPIIKMSQSMYPLKVSKCVNIKYNPGTFKTSKSLNTLNNINQSQTKYILEDITNKID